MVLFFGIYLVVRNAQVDFASQRPGDVFRHRDLLLLLLYPFEELLPVETYGYDAMFFILLILCFAWGGDTCACFAGRAFGKHKLCPVVKPKKTVEGAIGGVLGTMVFGVTYRHLHAANRMEAPPAPTHRRFDVRDHCPAGSRRGRCAGHLRRPALPAWSTPVRHQDYGTIFPGHGGILDRFDSVVFIAPFTMVVIAVFITECRR